MASALEERAMGKTTAEARITNIKDEMKAEFNLIPKSEIREVTVKDALCDTGSTMLTMPSRLIQQLGLDPFNSKVMKTTNGDRIASIYGPVRLTIQDRSCSLDVAEGPDSIPVLIGQVPLELLDFVVDLRSQKLIGNPAHGGEHSAHRGSPFRREFFGGDQHRRRGCGVDTRLDRDRVAG